jgi:hypothetical protein
MSLLIFPAVQIAVIVQPHVENVEALIVSYGPRNGLITLWVGIKLRSISFHRDPE